MASTSNGRFLSACVILTVLLTGTTAAGQHVDGETSGLSISIEDHRPLAALADELQRRYQIVVTYEDCPWVSASDLEDVTEAIIASNGPGRAVPSQPILVPRKAKNLL